MNITVSRRFEPIGLMREVWEMHSFERIVWAYDDGKSRFPEAVHIPAPKGYVDGQLLADVNGQRVDFHDFDMALTSIGMTRDTIVRQLAMVAAHVLAPKEDD